MLITTEFVFIHIPKTGGDFVRRLCRRRLPGERVVETDLAKHAPDTEIPAEYRHLPRFALVRNPWDWHVSWYHYLMGHGFPESHRDEIRDRSPMFVELSDDFAADFGTTIRRLYEPDEDLIARRPLVRKTSEAGIDLQTFHLRRQVGMSMDRGEVIFGKFENLRHDFHDFLNRHSVPLTDRFRLELFQEPPVNRSRRAEYQVYYDDDLAALIADRAVEVIDNWGYRYAVADGDGHG